jgi:hypothetical protein
MQTAWSCTVCGGFVQTTHVADYGTEFYPSPQILYCPRCRCLQICTGIAQPSADAIDIPIEDIDEPEVIE